MGTRRSAIAAVLGLVLLGAHCNGQDPDPDPNPGPDPPPDAASCDDACELIGPQGAKCPQGEPTPEGASCTEVCENAETSGAITLNPGCVVDLFDQDPLPADICEQVDSCTVFGEL